MQESIIAKDAEDIWCLVIHLFRERKTNCRALLSSFHLANVNLFLYIKKKKKKHVSINYLYLFELYITIYGVSFDFL